MWRPLCDTLLDLVGATAGASSAGITVTEADIVIPLELTAATHRGELTILATPPHSRWKAGFLPLTHPTRLSIRLMDD
jgi:hypothetical protein